MSLPVSRLRRVTLTTLSMALVLLLLTLLISFQLAPSVVEQRRDSGIFSYTGKIIFEGGLPYVDAWDNKLPGVYYIDALAFWLFGSNRWALWLIETFFVYLAAWVMLQLLGQLYPRRIAWVGTLALMMLVRHPALVSDTNFTEPYALLPQVLTLAAGYQFLCQPNARTAFVIGFSAGLAFVIKQTTAGAALVFIPALMFSRHPVLRVPQRWRWLGMIIGGGLSCLGLVALYLAANGILDDALNASFVSASAFHTWVSRDSIWIGATIWQTLTSSTFLLVYGPFLPFLVVGMRATVQKIPVASDPRSAAAVTLTIWAMFAFFADLVLANITYRAYEHYYVPLIPSAILLTAAGLSTIGPHAVQREPQSHRAQAAWLYLGVLLIVQPILFTLGRFWHAEWDITGPARHHALSTYIAEHTAPEDTVWVWGANTVLNFQSGRNSPTQFTYGYPLIVPNDMSAANIREVIHDLNANCPALIVDSTMRDGDRIPPLDPIRRQTWWDAGGRRDVADLTPIYQFVAEHCVVIEEFERTMIYRCHY